MSLLSVTSGSLDRLMEPMLSQGNRFCNEATLCFTRLLLQVKLVDLNVKLALQNVTGIYSMGEYSPGCFAAAKEEEPSPQPTAGWDERTRLLKVVPSLSYQL